MSASDRQRLHRARQRDGVIVLPVQIDEVALVEALRHSGAISPADADDREKLAEAAGRIIEEAVAT